MDNSIKAETMSETEMPSVRPNFWWVNQGITYQKEHENGTIWAPQFTESGREQYHWTNVSKVRQGDIIFHYANGFLRSVSIALQDAQEGSKPRNIAVSDEWQRDGYFAKVQYTDISQPIPLASIAEDVRKACPQKGPINRSLSVNQGYLFALDQLAASAIGSKINLNELPHAISQHLVAQAGDPTNAWDEFFYWAKKFYNEKTRTHERGYKIEISQKLQKVKELLDGGDSNWHGQLKDAFGPPNNLTYYINNTKFVEWAAVEPDAASQALLTLWDEKVEPSMAIVEFLSQLPVDVMSGMGTRLNMATFLSLERGATSHPVYRKSVFDLGLDLTSFDPMPADESLAYMYAIQLLSRILEEGHQRDMELVDLLDAQCVLWCVTNYAAREDWSGPEKQALDDYRKGRGGNGTPQSNAIPDTMPPTAEPGLPVADRDHPYSIADALNGLFLGQDAFQLMLDSLARKRNIILQGPPGVGKTFVAKRLAYAFLKCKTPARIEMVQFHQSYAYEDFVQGYRPDGNQGFQLKKGVFFDFCNKARQDEANDYVFIIDEINRGNLSKVFGELLMLIESDKRGPDYAIPLTYSDQSEPRFSVPSNVYLIGMMNTADRSLAMVDYALRRRFTFIDLEPQFNTDGFRVMLKNSVDDELIEKIISSMTSLNNLIAEDSINLGPGFRIGHSFFCPQDTDDALGIEWYRAIIRSEIAPLLREYWFDAPQKAQEQISKLLQ